ncbi:hypothetical protein ACLOJK_041911 [Asimina triloba]
MEYQRPVSRCTKSASDLAGETVAALASASLVFRNEKDYSEKLVQAAEELFAFATVQDNMGIYTADEKCGAEAQMFYNSSGYYDELAWAGVWLYFATGNDKYLTNATDMFKSAMQNELAADSGVFYWNNKLPAVVVLLSRLRYFHDSGFQYQDVLKTSSSIADKLMCSYLSLPHNFNITPELVDCDTKGEDLGCNGGYMDDAFLFIQHNHGLTTETNYPYTAADGTCDTKKEANHVAAITGHEDVPVNNEKALLKAVAHQPIAVAIDASGFKFQFYKSGVFQGPCGTDLDHGVAAIGYGTAADGGKYWLVKNSWGTSGGEDGYIMMQRDVSPKSGLVEWSGVPAMVVAFSLLAVGTSMIGTMLGFFQFFEEQLSNLTFPSLPTKSLQEKWAAREGGGGLGPALRWRCHRVHCTATYG